MPIMHSNTANSFNEQNWN